MDRIRVARQVRALRRRKRWRQADLARAARVSRTLISRIECGRADTLTVATLDRVTAALGARFDCRLTWNGEALDRLLDEDHASVVERVVRILDIDGWLVATEVSFNMFGERGSVDVLAFHAATRTLLVVEVKTVVPDVQATLMTLDRKARLGPEIARLRGWRPARIWVVLVIRDARTARRRVEAHAATFASTLPARTAEVRGALRSPSARSSALRGIWFLPDDTQAVTRQRVHVAGPA